MPPKICGSQKFWQNAGKMKNSGKIRAKIRAKFGENLGNLGENSGKTVEGENKKRQKENSGKFTGKERKINCVFKSIKLFENYSQEVARFVVEFSPNFADSFCPNYTA